MKVKKKDKKGILDKKSQFEQLQADHEQFLQAFDKPTHIYRYLRERHSANPMFLHRTLNYMQGRCSRKKNTRNGIKVDSLSTRMAEKLKIKNNVFRCENLDLVFKCLCAKGNNLVEKAEVEVILSKKAHYRRKDIPSNSREKKIKAFTLPSTSGDGSKYKTGGEVLHVSGDEFLHGNGAAVRAYSLKFNVKCRKREGGPLENGMYNGYLESDTDKTSDSECQPAPKKRKKRGNFKDTITAEVSDKVLYDGELMIFDHQHQKLLTNGEYEVVLYDTMYHRDGVAQWEIAADTQGNQTFDVFRKNPRLKFEVKWAKNENIGSSETDVQENREVEKLNGALNNNICVTKPVEKSGGGTIQEPKRIFYHFVYNNNTRQQTETLNDLQCPWCSINCITLYSLLKHLRMCHPRFTFLYSEHPKGARIAVSVNLHYDGAYVGGPHDLQSHIGFAFSRLGPVHRTPVTQLLVYKPKKVPFDLAEFLEPESENPGIRHIAGHNRLYYHTVTLQPVRPCEIELDSEEEINAEWIKEKTINLIDDFTDVNEGEKEIMKMWNIHMMKHNYIGDVQLPKACTTFVQEYGADIISKRLCQNFVLHLVNLYDFGLVKPDVVTRTVMQIFRLSTKMEADGLLTEDRKFLTGFSGIFSSVLSGIGSRLLSSKLDLGSLTSSSASLAGDEGTSCISSSVPSPL